MQCEVCGREITRKPLAVTIEGAEMMVCGKCAQLGRAVMKPASLTASRKRKAGKPLVTRFSMKRQSIETTKTLELVDNFGPLIRRAREDLGFSHEDLGKKIGEKVSVLRKIEREKMTPDHQLAAKLEHALRIKLLVLPSEPEVPKSLPKPPEITLGRIAHLKKSRRDSTKG